MHYLRVLQVGRLVRLHATTCRIARCLPHAARKSTQLSNLGTPAPSHSKSSIASLRQGKARAGAATCAAVSTPSTKRRVRHILVPAGEGRLLARLQEELEGGASFEDLASQHSICPSAKRGGELGWVKQGMGLPPAFEAAIFDADIEDLFSTDSHKGLHIVQVLDEKEVVEVQTMTVQQLAELMQRGKDAAQYIDVREEGEFNIAKLPHFELLPLSRFSEWGPTLTERFDPDEPTVCLCHAGIRSRQFANLLIDQGFTQVYNISGGIEAYSCLVDRTVPRY